MGKLAGGGTHAREVIAVGEERGHGPCEMVGCQIGLRQKHRRLGVGQGLGIEALVIVGRCG